MRGLWLHELAFLNRSSLLVLHEVLGYGLLGLGWRCLASLRVGRVSNICIMMKNSVGKAALRGTLAVYNVCLITLNDNCIIQSSGPSVTFIGLVMGLRCYM